MVFKGVQVVGQADKLLVAQQLPIEQRHIDDPDEGIDEKDQVDDQHGNHEAHVQEPAPDQTAAQRSAGGAPHEKSSPFDKGSMRKAGSFPPQGRKRSRQISVSGLPGGQGYSANRALMFWAAEAKASSAVMTPLMAACTPSRKGTYISLYFRL